jgi:hypothetical protein
MISARVTTDRLDKVWDSDIAPDIRKYQIAVAREAFAEEKRRGFDKNARTVIDRRRYDAPIESVQSFGVIEYIARVDIREAAEWVWAEVIRRSPVDSGRYQDSHVVMINGVSVDSLDGYQPGDKIQIVNIQPYSRKIERGLSLLAPNGVYRLVYAAARRRFRDAFVQHKWVKLDSGVKVSGLAGGGRRRERKMRDAVYPAIQIFQARQ